jgi:hypothetical protein
MEFQNLSIATTIIGFLVGFLIGLTGKWRRLFTDPDHDPLSRHHTRHCRWNQSDISGYHQGFRIPYSFRQKTANLQNVFYRALGSIPSSLLAVQLISAI